MRRYAAPEAAGAGIAVRDRNHRATLGMRGVPRANRAAYIQCRQQDVRIAGPVPHPNPFHPPGEETPGA